MFGRLCRVCVVLSIGFGASAQADLTPLSIQDVVTSPGPVVADTAGAGFVLRAGTTPAGLLIQTVGASAGTLLDIRGQDNMVNLTTNPVALGAAGAVKVTISAGSSILVLPDLDVRFTDSGAATRTIYLPATSLNTGQTRILWVGSDGATFNGTGAQTVPDFTSLARAASGPWLVREAGFATEQVATGFQLPIGVAFLPGALASNPVTNAPWCYVAERYGTIKLVRRNGSISDYVTGLLNFTGGGVIPGVGEQGVGGLCIEPVTGDVIASVLYDPTPPSTSRFAKVVRLHSNDGGLTAASQTTILDLAGAAQDQPRQIGGVSIGPDGKLYINNGDGSETATAQDNTSFKGKVLRVNLDGSAPSDNPLYDGPPFTPIDYIYASGVRNPLGVSWRALDNAGFFVDPGATTDRLSRLVRGRNYLWDGLDTSMASFALYNWPGLGTAPNLVNVGATGIAFVQAQTFGGSGLTAALYGRAYVTEAGAAWTAGPLAGTKRVCEFNIDASGNFISGPLPVVEYNGTGRATCAGIAAGPDGIYFTDLYRDQGASAPTDAGADLVRIKYTGFAGMLASPTQAAAAPLAVQFTDASTVLGASAWYWSFGDGTTSTLRNPQHTYSANGLYTVRLTVTGTSGAVTLQRTNLIRVGQPPAIAIIVGSLAPVPSADQAIANRMTALGYQVTLMDDEPTNRPGATLISQSYSLVMVSSTITSANVAGEFRLSNIPMVFWESALMRSGRESLSDNGTTAATNTQITVLDNTHPVTQGLALGNVAMFATNQTMGFGSGAISSQALSLATRINQPTQPTIMVAERGATLVGNYVTPARRVFLFFDDASYNAGNAAAKAIMDRAVCWAMELSPSITTQPVQTTTPPGQTAMLSVVASGQAPLSYQWRKAGVPLANGGRISGATSPTLTITSSVAGDTATYDVVVTNSCANTTSNGVLLRIGSPCPADVNNSGALTVQDIFDFLTSYFSGTLSGDFNHSGAVSVQDIFDFLSAYFAGCT